MDQKRIEKALKKVNKYIDDLTIKSKDNIPHNVVSDIKNFFTWDNEKRNPLEQPYLFDWSYYNGVVMEGLYYLYIKNPQEGMKYYSYIKEYLDSMIINEKGKNILNPNLAGYVDYHGGDCYKTASLLIKMSDGKDPYFEIARDLYQDLTDSTHSNIKGNVVSLKYTEKALGNNYWHGWGKSNPPKYKVWLDGIYMAQPFLAHFATLINDEKQLALINERLTWVSRNMLASNGLYYHAANSKEDVCPYHWLRAIGWYGMAMVDVMEVLPKKYLEERKMSLKLFVDGMLKYQHPSGLWANLVDRPVTNTNRLETSGTAMLVYTILKGVRNDWLSDNYLDPAIKAFLGLVDLKLTEEGLKDIYLKASANNLNNYENLDYYLVNEGKGVGPFIMAYSEMLYLIK